MSKIKETEMSVKAVDPQLIEVDYALVTCKRVERGYKGVVGVWLETSDNRLFNAKNPYYVRDRQYHFGSPVTSELVCNADTDVTQRVQQGTLRATHALKLGYFFNATSILPNNLPRVVWFEVCQIRKKILADDSEKLKSLFPTK